MKRFSFLLVAMVLAVLAMGCATGQVLPDAALTKPEDAVSFPHPVELERAGVKAITIFWGLMNPTLFTEFVPGGGGVWPAVAISKNGKTCKGYGYFLDINNFGDPVLQFVFACSKDELAGARIVYFNRDAGWCYSLAGREAGDEKVKYEPAKYSDTKFMGKLVEQFGIDLATLDTAWRRYFLERRVDPAGFSFVTEIKVGSAEWETFKKNLDATTKQYKMANGEIRAGNLPVDDFRRVASEMPGFSGGERMLKNTAIPVVSAAVPIVGLASVVGAALNAAIDDSWSGYYARARCLRYELAPVFRYVCNRYRERIMQLHMRNLELGDKLSQKNVSQSLGKKEE